MALDNPINDEEAEETKKLQEVKRNGAVEGKGRRHKDDEKAESDASNEGTISMKYPGVFLTETNDRDVLQGRGSGSNLYQGNMVYRDMIEEVATSYTSTSSRKEKNRLVNELISVIHGMNGRFLHPVDTDEATTLGLDPNKDFFFEITDADAVDKVKQAIRYVHYKKRPLMEQRRKAAVERGDVVGRDTKKPRSARSVSISDSNSSNAESSFQKLLNQLSTSNAAGRESGDTGDSNQQFLQLQRQLLLKQQLQGASNSPLQSSSSAPGSSVNRSSTQDALVDIIAGLQQQGRRDQGASVHQVIQQHLLVQQLQQLQQQQIQQRQQQQQLLQSLLQLQPDQQTLLAALGTRPDQTSGTTSQSSAAKLVASLLQQVPVAELSDPLQAQIQQLFLQRTQLQAQQSVNPLQDQIKQLLRQQSHHDGSRSHSDGAAGGPAVMNESDFSFDEEDEDYDRSFMARREGKRRRSEDPMFRRFKKPKRRKAGMMDRR
ncbi:hypothetical protein IV203_017157 [Nitzschia inconspicua]|uniref:DUF6824 domain-containing protein n=1 Tax=Nitzschia inconspicua TaxID=303405 RepID=A0A9K3KR97_9STRA|nr:hypothetical protein IV203_017157 [Nitzschia inconspicua]